MQSILCERPTIELYSGCQVTKGCLGESKKDFRNMCDDQKAVTQTRVEQCPIKGHVDG